VIHVTPEEARSLRQGLLIAAAYLREEESELERLLIPFTKDDNLSQLADAFVYVGLVAVDTTAYSKGVSFEQALRDTKPLGEVTLLVDLPGGPWDEVLRLASKAKHGNSVGQEPIAMDVPSAINVTFRLAISALAELAQVPRFANMTAAELADMFSQGIAAGHGVDTTPH
jgi:hypothetical protein